MDEAKRCWMCTLTKPTTDFHKNRTTKDGLEQVCKTCKAKETKKRRDKRAELGLCHCGRIRKEEYLTCELHVHTSRNWSRANPKKHIEAGREWRQDVRDRVFNHYGNACACCGETIPQFLTIDHIGGGGTKHRKEVGGGVVFYSWLIRNSFPEGFQTLCQNCNVGKFRNGGVCPHVELRKAHELAVAGPVYEY